MSYLRHNHNLEHNHRNAVQSQSPKPFKNCSVLDA